MKKVLGDKQGGGGQREREGRPRGAKRERHPVFRLVERFDIEPFPEFTAK